MRFVLWANGNRGVSCLEALLRAGYRPTLVVAHPQRGAQWYGSVIERAGELGLPTLAPEDPHGPEVVEALRREEPDLFVLAGYGPILRTSILDIPKRLSINLHAGKLPRQRGSSPMNWALVNGDTSITLSIIRVEAGVDSGDVLIERSFPISLDTTIQDLHDIANTAFPEMLLEVMRQIENDALRPRRQDPAQARYFPLRFPEDGFVLWDMLTAEQIHNRIRALRPPYPGAFTYFHGRKVTLISSALGTLEVRGEPGRVYRKTETGLLICAQDRCLWIREARFADDGAPLMNVIQRYQMLATVRGAVLQLCQEGGRAC